VATLAGAAPNTAVDGHASTGRKVYRTVRRLQARSVKAVREGQGHTVKALAYLLTHSVRGRARAIVRVVSNSGAKTPGVDGTIWNTPAAKSAAFRALRRHDDQSRPLRRVDIPKSNGRRRPLGILTLVDRAMQALSLLGLDPIAETLADGHSSGCRRERCCADAVDEGPKMLRRPHGRDTRGPDWVVEAASTSCADRFHQAWLLDHLPRDRVVWGKWRKAGYLEKHARFATTEGTPQGGVISPALAHRALDGWQRLRTERCGATRSRQRMYKVHLVRYAADLIIRGSAPFLLEHRVQPLVEQLLQARGLELSHEKTRSTPSEDGFDVLGQTIRRQRNGKVISKPSKRTGKTFLAKVQDTIDHAGSLTAGDMIGRLNQQIKGWTMDHRVAGSGRTFAAGDHRIFWSLRRWGRQRHHNKSWRWSKKQYVQQADGAWAYSGVIRDRKGTGWPIRLRKAAGVKVLRWQKIRSDANPYDPGWELYLEERECWKRSHTLANRGRID
jgi:RNA-directed DNA polymerase